MATFKSFQLLAQAFPRRKETPVQRIAREAELEEDFVVDEDLLEEFEHKRREKLAIKNEY